MYVHCSDDHDLSLQSDQNFLFKAYLCRRKAAPLYVPTCENLPHNRKWPKHTFHLKRSLVSAVAVSQHACFYSFMPLSEFLSSCLLHHWAMRFSSQWNLILLLYAQECFPPLEWQGEFTFLLTVPEKHPLEASLFARCLVYKGAETHSTHCTKSPFLEVSVKAPFSATQSLLQQITSN